MKALEYLLYVTLFTAFFPLPAYLYVQLGLSVVQFILIVFLLATHKISPKEVLNVYSVFLVSLLLFSVVSFLWVLDIGGWINYTAILFATIVNSFVLWINLSKKNVIRNIIKVLLAVILVQNIVGWFEVATGIYPFAFGIDSNNMAYNRLLRRPITFFKNVNDYATFLLFGLIFIMSYEPKGNLYTKVPLTLKRMAKWLLVLSTLGLIFMVGSRGILLLSLVAIALIFILKLKDSVYGKRILLIGIGTILFLLMGYISLNGFPTMDHLNEGDAARINLMLNGFEYLKDTLLVGVGPGNVSFYLDAYRPFEIGHLRTIHNWWIEFLVMYGVVFFVAYIILYIKNLFTSIKEYRSKQHNLFIFTTAWSLSFIVASIISSSLFTTVWVMYAHNLIFLIVGKASLPEMKENHLWKR